MTIETTRRMAMEALRPPPRLRLSEWIERSLRLPSDVSALPGPVRLYPYQREIADTISDPLITRVSVQKSARIGYSTLLTGAIASHVVNDPALILAVLPTEEDCRRFVTSDVEPIFAASPCLAGTLSGDLQEKNRNTMLSRRFAGGSLKVVGAKSPKNLRGHNARVLILDEVDGMDITAEGSPIALAEMRTAQFPDRKIILGSTPVFEETSLVIRAYAQSDQRIYEVPCPCCGSFHELKWKDIQWPEGQPAKAAWRCPSCEEIVSEQHKTSMVAQGRWRALRPEVEGHAGFKINALVAPLANATWGKLAVEFVAAKDDPNTLQTFTNLVLGEGWREEGEELDQTALQARAEPFGADALPEPVLAVTAGVDVQRDRIEVTYIGWAEDDTAYVLGHRVVWGAPDENETWRELDDLLKHRFPHPYGGTLGVDAAAVDSGDGQTMEAVHSFCRGRSARKVLAVKGDGGKRPWFERSQSKAQKGRLWIVGVDGLKSHLMARLNRGNSIRFSNSLPASWYDQLASERAIVRYSHGQPSRRFERIKGKRAEALDCTVYGFAVRGILNVPWSARAEQLRTAIALPTPKPRPRVIASAWMEN